MSLYGIQSDILQNEINKAAGLSWKYMPEPISDDEGNDDMDDYDHIYSHPSPPGTQESAITTTDGASDEAEATILDYSEPTTNVDNDSRTQNTTHLNSTATSENTNGDDDYVNGFTVKYDSSSSTSNNPLTPDPAVPYYQPTKQEVAQDHLIWARCKLISHYPWLILCPTNDFVPAERREVHRRVRESNIACLLRGLRGVTEVGWEEEEEEEEEE